MLESAMVKFGSDRGLAQEVTPFAGSITDNRMPNYRQLSQAWRISNSEGYAKWFESRMKLATQLMEQRAFVARAATVDDLPTRKWFAAVLAETKASTQDREQALRWVVHLVGDAHQPLHCCDRNDDKGGNKVPVLLRDAKKPTNLHAVWDTPMLRTYIGSKSVTAYAEALDAKATSEDVKVWQTGSPLDWANETHLVGVNDVYGDLPAGDPIKLDTKYVSTKQPVVEKQLERAGVRLAVVLNRSLIGATTRTSK